MALRRRIPALNWEDIRYFLGLSEAGSLSATARALGVNHATVARHVDSLESRLGRVLFDRRADGYALTKDGRDFLEEALAMERSAQAMLDRVDETGVIGGPVRLTTIALLAEYILVPGLADFHRAYPAIDLEILVDTRLLSLAKREADIALRLGHPQDSELLCRRIGAIDYEFYGTNEWEARIKNGEAPDFVGFEKDTVALVSEARWLAERFPNHRTSMRVNGHAAQATAAQAGFGVVLLPRFLGKSFPGLRPIDLGETHGDRPIWLVMRPDLARQPRIRVLADALAALF